MLDDHGAADEYAQAFEPDRPAFTPWSKGYIVGFLSGVFFTALGFVILSR